MSVFSRFVGQKLLISFLTCLLFLRTFSHRISETWTDTDLCQALCANRCRGRKQYMRQSEVNP